VPALSKANQITYEVVRSADKEKQKIQYTNLRSRFESRDQRAQILAEDIRDRGAQPAVE